MNELQAATEEAEKDLYAYIDLIIDAIEKAVVVTEPANVTIIGSVRLVNDIISS